MFHVKQFSFLYVSVEPVINYLVSHTHTRHPFHRNAPCIVSNVCLIQRKAKEFLN